MKIINFIFLLLISLITTAQQKDVETNDISNYTDSNGLRQGKWAKKYSNGNIKYTGKFKDNRPIGEFKRYYKNKSLQSVMIYSKEGTSARTTFYYKNGEIAAEGKYFGTKKDSLWKYYSYYGEHLSNIESYNKGLKNGISREFYSDGAISQEKLWKNGALDGPWKMWFPGNKLRLETQYKNGKINGLFKSFYPDGTMEISGNYLNDIRVGEWTYVNEETKKKKIIRYIGGLPDNQDEIDRSFEQSMEIYEMNKGKLKDPAIEDFQKNFRN